MPIKTSPNLPPFVRFCTASVPMVFDDSLSYYECLCALCNFIQKNVVDVINNNAEILAALEEYVKHYFDNLDVQEEINNKLDAMAEAGTLTDIITDYLNLKSELAYDTVADMKSATNLVDGCFVETYGYYAVGDGGGAKYKITDTENSSAKQEQLDSGLYAELVTGKVLNVNAFGCYGDGTHDDTTALQAAVDFAITNGLDLKGDGNYRVTDTITFDQSYGKRINLNNVTAVGLGNKPLFYMDHCRYDQINVNAISGEKITVPDISGEYEHSAAFLLHGTTCENIRVQKIENFVCGFTLYSTGGSGAEGAYYNDISCKKCDTFYFTHFLANDGCVNGNTFRNSLHYVTSWVNTGAYDQYMLLNESIGTAPVYVNNHNTFTDMMAEKIVDNDGVTYYVADLSDANSTTIEINRIEIQPAFDLDKIIVTNAQSSYNSVIFKSGWFTIPLSKAVVGNNNYISSFNNYKNSLVGQKFINSSYVTLNANFVAIENDICSGHTVYYPSEGRARISGLFKSLTNLSADTNYQFCSFTRATAPAISNGIVYSVNSYNPTVLTPVGTIRQVKDQYYSYIRFSTDIAADSGFYVDFTLE